jgi:hypothetical protein
MVIESRRAGIYHSGMPSEDGKALRREYAGLYEQVEAILFRHDPAGINFGENRDEYDPEVSTILPRVVRATSHDEVQQIVREEFEHWFGSDSIMREESFEVIAAEVFEAVVSHRST